VIGRTQSLSVAFVVMCLTGCGHEMRRSVAPQPRIEQPQHPLGARALPFAEYITAVHRQIHQRFTLGFLSDIDARKDPTFANDALWTQLEIVINEDGRLDRVGVIRSSGVRAFDEAALASVTAAAPFPRPGDEIKSSDGKVYLDWQFHRDERACGTFGVDPHVLTIVGGRVEYDISEPGSHAKGARPTVPSGQQSDADDARAAAAGWFAAYTRHDWRWLAGWSAIPFSADGKVIARDVPALEKLYKDMVATQSGRLAVERAGVFTPEQIRAQLGELPPGGEPSGMLYAPGSVGGNQLILLLKRSTRGWRVCGITGAGE
jgi:TonB family protein